MPPKSRMPEGKKKAITMFLQEYNVQNAEDLHEAFKDLFGETLKEMLQAEMANHLGYSQYERSENKNYRNCLKPKKVRANMAK
jgi:transposase-like protein